MVGADIGIDTKGLTDIYLSDGGEAFVLNVLTGVWASLNEPRYAVKINERVYEEVWRESIPRYSETRTPLDKHIAKLTKAAGKVPAGAQPVFEFEVDGGWEAGDDTYWLVVGFLRDPTEEEKAERRGINKRVKARQKSEAEESAEKERAEFERLKAKYEG